MGAENAMKNGHKRGAESLRSVAFRSKPALDPTAFMVGVDGRSAVARRFRDVVGAIAEDLGGVDAITEGELQLVRRAAFMCVQTEIMEAEVANGSTLDAENYVRFVNALNRTPASIGLKRRPRDVTPDLHDYVEGSRR